MPVPSTRSAARGATRSPATTRRPPVGTPDDFRYLVDALHQAGIGVILDWVPAHFPKDEWALARFDGTPLYEHADPRRGEHPDWGTLSSTSAAARCATSWSPTRCTGCEEFHIDGLRVDAVASMLYLDYSRKEGEWTPNVHGGRENLEAVAFLQEMNATVYKRAPGRRHDRRGVDGVAGRHPPDPPGGLGFGFKWNMGWMHDTLATSRTSRSTAVPPPRDDVLDGVRVQRELRAAAQPRRGRARQGLAARQDARRPLAAARQPARLPGLHVGAPRQAAAVHGRRVRGFAWIVGDAVEDNVFAFLRHAGDGSPLLAVSNFSPVVRQEYRLGVPDDVPAWHEVLNTDAGRYGGGAVANADPVKPDAQGCHGRPASIRLTLPPLATVWLRPA
jgi:1,4-alpha-glucan branching enzyme